MTRSTPRLSPRAVFGRARSDGIRAYFEGHGASRYSLYGYGKVAARDGIDVLLAERPEATNVVLPAYLPYGIVEPFREAGLEPRYYGCNRALRPDIDHIEDLLDPGTLAVMFAHYFGQPQSREDVAAITGLCEEYEAYTIDDNAHSALSTLDGRLLGTVGDVGITSLHKTLPIPNGAVLFFGNDDLPDEEATRSAVRDRYTKADYRYCARSFGRSVSGRPVLKQALSTVRWMNDRRPHKANGHVDTHDVEEDPRAIYEATKVPMSRLSLHVLDRTDPADVIAARRANYRIWDREIRDLDGVEPVFESLSEGACPQYYPALVDDPDDLGPLSGTGKPWPPLPHEVRDEEAFATENALSTHLHTLPVHQGLDLRDRDGLGGDGV
ncbi:DegT/DnrJ/EryC1/StrS family aminotransferase [Halalkalicoccus sp. NIPERK01]|uniref:DegT/DnrJ/EryC1/StrS family aminotransferase n=1 Tax=Halalkalicoccus sp. NIPERK01 TaxID=3053469 RepID=UPI00256EC9D6|nr:DegT/DnrJ/EryC1/StrS family aminotransferase [Halalkalicoccus sp. NIPERK01]MDL5362036.1 DegT/DnrJ/EryC1/StrS family aminotransferase [Halalkalicoccus sp. NIPERK01]